MNYQSYFSFGDRTVETCLVGTGGFGRSFMVQTLKIPHLSARIAVDLNAETVRDTMISAGIPGDAIRVCTTPDEARAAFDAGAYIATDALANVIALPFDILVEATGHPEAGAAHARMAIEADRHVAMVSKEVDSVVGPGLAAMARERCRLVSPVDGDQPSLLVALVTWARLLGFEILSAGKASEYDFVFDAESGRLTSNGVEYDLPAFAPLAKLGDADPRDMVARRASCAAALPQRSPADLCELVVSANALGLAMDRADLHAPIARIDEVPKILTPTGDGGILDTPGTLDVFHCLRTPGEISFAGGVFVVVRCEDEATWQMLAEKGHVVDMERRTALLFTPRHLLGLEVATTLFDVCLNGRSTGAEDLGHHVDLVAYADADLPAGTMLTMGGHHHTIDSVSPRAVSARRLDDDAPAPFYLAANNALRNAVGAGEPIRMADLVLPADSALLAIRRDQDRRFFPA